ncbi:MAG: LLM class flavin-dependent oxidoreductase [Ilumatobacteraceae bacterium]|nr:LLM class flavin-dependent oxidoreductase [Ilumatobacteraceae bacterium]
MDTGIELVANDESLADLIRIARRADEAGVDSIWVGEYFRSGPVVAAAIAQATTQIRIGTAIALGLVRSPLITAITALDIDELSGGRFTLGLGSQVKRAMNNWHGLEFDHPATRMRECVEAVQVCMAAGPGVESSYAGTYYDIDLAGYLRAPVPERQVPVLLAAVRPTMIKMAARSADGVLGHILWSQRYLENVVTPILADVGADFERAQTVVGAVHADAGQARIDAKRTLGFYAATRTYRTILEEDGFGDDADRCANALASGDISQLESAVSDAMLDTYAITGNPEEFKARLAQRTGSLDTAIVIPPYFGTPANRLLEHQEGLIDVLASVAGARRDD